MRYARRLLLNSLALASMAAGSVAARAEGWARQCAAHAADGDYATCAKAVAAAPADPALHRFYAISLSKAGRYDASIEQYRQVTRLAPRDGRAFYEYAWMLAFIRRYREAVQPIEQAIRLRPNHADTYRTAAIIYFIVKRPRDVFRVALAGAKLGDPIAMFDTYTCYVEGSGTAKNDAQAFYWLVKAAEAGHVTAMDRLVAIFLNGGLGQAPNDRKAEEWATKARLARAGKI